MDDLISRMSLKQSIVVSAILEDKKTLEQIIDDEPSIDAVPVKHGKWNPHPFEKEWDVCSSCGTGCKRREREFDHLGQKSVTEYNYQYCPWCGAKMDERRTDEQT